MKSLLIELPIWSWGYWQNEHGGGTRCCWCLPKLHAACGFQLASRFTAQVHTEPASECIQAAKLQMRIDISFKTNKQQISWVIGYCTRIFTPGWGHSSLIWTLPAVKFANDLLLLMENQCKAAALPSIRSDYIFRDTVKVIIKILYV